jgi:hypothetical protein
MAIATFHWSEQLRLYTRSQLEASDEARAVPKFRCGVFY